MEPDTAADAIKGAGCLLYIWICSPATPELHVALQSIYSAGQLRSSQAGTGALELLFSVLSSHPVLRLERMYGIMISGVSEPP